MGTGMYRVSKEYSFDSAHRLIQNYQGKCAHLHGHTWKVRLQCSSWILNGFGFVRDFSDFKPVKEWIDAELDHGVLVSQDDRDLIFYLEQTKQRHFITPANPTSENLCKLIFEKARELGIPVTAVEIDETCTSNARYEE